MWDHDARTGVLADTEANRARKDASWEGTSTAASGGCGVEVETIWVVCTAGDKIVDGPIEARVVRFVGDSLRSKSFG